jgi:hypothetical protein
MKKESSIILKAGIINFLFNLSIKKLYKLKKIFLFGIYMLQFNY